MNSFTIAGLGEVLWDIYDDQKYLGGAPANFAAHVVQAGHKGIVMSRVGKDELGTELLMLLNKMKLSTDTVQQDSEKPTGTVHVKIDDKGIPQFECTENVAFDYMNYDSSWKKMVNKIDAVLFGTLAQRNATSRKAIQAFLDEADAAVKMFDINIRGWDDSTKEAVTQSLKYASIIKLNKDELEQLKSALGSQDDNVTFLRFLMRDYNIKLAAITLGDRGCYMVTETEVEKHPGFNVKVVDTTGAGDAFAAGLIIKHLERAFLEEIADFANRLGAFVTTQKGAVSTWTASDLDKLKPKSSDE